MRTSTEIQSEASALATELGRLRGEYLHREKQIADRFQAIDGELRDAYEREAKQTPAALHERLVALEAAATKGT